MVNGSFVEVFEGHTNRTKYSFGFKSLWGMQIG